MSHQRIAHLASANADIDAETIALSTLSYRHVINSKQVLQLTFTHRLTFILFITFKRQVEATYTCNLISLHMHVQNVCLNDATGYVSYIKDLTGSKLFII